MDWMIEAYKDYFYDGKIDKSNLIFNGKVKKLTLDIPEDIKQFISIIGLEKTDRSEEIKDSEKNEKRIYIYDKRPNKNTVFKCKIYTDKKANDNNREIDILLFKAELADKKIYESLNIGPLKQEIVPGEIIFTHNIKLKKSTLSISVLK